MTVKDRMKTSVIGSYPVSVDSLGIMSRYFQMQESSWERYIQVAVRDMVSAGVCMVSDGQTRDPFIQLFTRRLGGCRVRARTEVIGPVEYCGPIILKDQQVVRRLLSGKGELVGVLTGPFTLMKSCVDMFYHDERELAFAFADVVRQEASELQHHVDCVSIDEPFFSTEMPEYGKELIDCICKSITVCPTRLHVCGDVSQIVSDLLEMPVDILAHEFKASPHLFDAFSEHSGFPQSICLGSVRSDSDRVESVEEIVSHIEHGLDVFGEKLIQLSPDCGQRLLPRKAAYQKLKNLVQAGERVYGS
ncbi:MAG: hypothetical protein V1726_02525 [Methanobacteriota archaeon]